MPESNLSRLTSMERSVLMRLCLMYDLAEIASQLNIKYRTLTHHLQQIYIKLGVKQRHTAVKVALEELALTDDMLATNYSLLKMRICKDLDQDNRR